MPRRRARRAAAGAAAIALSILSLSGCGTSSSNAAADSSTDSRFVWIGYEDGDPIQKPLGCGAQAAAAESGDTVEMKTIGSGFTPAQQIPVLQAAAATKPAGIIVSPVHQNALQGPIDTIIAGGIPVITSNQQIADPAELSAELILDNYQAGKLAADHLAEKAAGKDVKVAILSFTQGASTAADGELNGFNDQLEKYPNVHNVASRFGDINTSTYVGITSDLLTQHPDLFGIFTTFAQPANAALASIAQNRASTIVVAGYAANDANLTAALRDGGLSAIVDFDWRELGYRSAKTIIAAARDDEPQPEVTLPASITTSENADQLTKDADQC